MPTKPTILNKTLVASSKLFHIEQLDLKFSNQVVRQYERLKSTYYPGAVIIAPLIKTDTVLLVREYCAGVDRYELGLPKGRIESGETIYEAADRELKEEAGFGARKFRFIAPLTLAPAYMSHSIDLVVGWELYEERLEGDEPEQLDVVEWPLSDIPSLIQSGECTEARTIAALYLTLDYLKKDTMHDGTEFAEFA